MKYRLSVVLLFPVLALMLSGCGGFGGKNDKKAVSYAIVDLGLLAGPESEVKAINNAATDSETLIVGYVQGSPCKWNLNGSKTLLPASPLARGKANAINDSGRIAGSNVSTVSSERACDWFSSTQTIIGTLKTDADPDKLAAMLHDDISIAEDINAGGEMAGAAETNNKETHAFAYIGNNMIDLGILSGGIYSHAYSINDKNEVVGVVETAFGHHAFLWRRTGSSNTSGIMYDIGTLLGDDYCVANCINNNTQIVGYSYAVSDKYYAAFIYEGGKMNAISIPEATTSKAYAINDSGTVVGTYTFVDKGGSKTNISHAFLWKNGVFTDLNSLLPPGSKWVMNSATAINNKGQIVGSGTFDGVTRGFLLKPVL